MRETSGPSALRAQRGAPRWSARRGPCSRGTPPSAGATSAGCARKPTRPCSPPARDASFCRQHDYFLLRMSQNNMQIKHTFSAFPHCVQACPGHARGEPPHTGSRVCRSDLPSHSRAPGGQPGPTMGSAPAHGHACAAPRRAQGAGHHSAREPRPAGPQTRQGTGPRCMGRAPSCGPGSAAGC